MTVKELIERLKFLDPEGNSEIIAYANDGYGYAIGRLYRGNCDNEGIVSDGKENIILDIKT